MENISIPVKFVSKVIETIAAKLLKDAEWWYDFSHILNNLVDVEIELTIRQQFVNNSCNSSNLHKYFNEKAEISRATKIYLFAFFMLFNFHDALTEEQTSKQTTSKSFCK